MTNIWIKVFPTECLVEKYFVWFSKNQKTKLSFQRHFDFMMSYLKNNNYTGVVDKTLGVCQLPKMATKYLCTYVKELNWMLII